MPARTCLRRRLCRHSDEVRLDVMALGHLDYKEDFPFTCCIRLRIYDVSYKKKKKTLLAPVLGCDEVGLVYLKRSEVTFN